MGKLKYYILSIEIVFGINLVSRQYSKFLKYIKICLGYFSVNPEKLNS
jgi:hypothetical protein